MKEGFNAEKAEGAEGRNHRGTKTQRRRKDEL
jgi:hypothetical protein